MQDELKRKTEIVVEFVGYDECGRPVFVTHERVAVAS